MARKKTPKGRIVQVRVTVAEKARIERAAEAENRTVSNWLYGLILRGLEASESESERRKVAEPRPD